jgi:DNA polymerase III epsilon subunit-like protein
MKPILKIINQYGNYKNPSLNEIYKYNFKTDVENAHNSLYDVYNLHKVVEHMYKNNTLKYDIDISNSKRQIKQDTQTKHDTQQAA